MESVDWTAMITTIVGGFPVFGALAIAWWRAEMRADRAEVRAIAAEERTRAVMRECVDLPSEASQNHTSDV